MIRVTLTLGELEDNGACDEGCELFDELLPDGIDCEWTWLHSAWAAIAFGEHYHWAVQRRLVPGLNLCEVNLRDADLYGANLRDADLYGANLRDADLYGANLRDASLCGAMNTECARGLPKKDEAAE